MGLPRVTINFANGALGAVADLADGVVGLICTAVAVPSTFALNTAYKLTSPDDLAVLGITAANNPALYKHVSEFYTEAGTGSGAELWIYGVADTVTLTQMLDSTSATGARALQEAANGRIRVIVAARKPAGSYTPTTTNGLDSDVYTAITNGQVLAGYCKDTYQAPVLVLIEGRSYTGTAANLTNMRQASNNAVAVLIGDTASDSGNACVGLLAGRIAKIPVQRNIGRVKDGSLAIAAAYIKDKTAEKADTAGIHDKGYVTIRTFTGRTGYFFSDDPTCSLVSDDYSQITARRTVDKAYRVAYDTLLNELLDELPVTAEGTLTPAFAKSLENKVEAAIVNTMTINGNLGNDTTDTADKGVQCFVDYTQNVISTSKVMITLKVKPYGYARYIEVKLGFQTLTA